MKPKKPLDKCPHCSGISGFSFTMKVTYEMIGPWGEEAEAGDSTTTSKGRAKCIDCGQSLSWKDAEGKGSEK